MSCKNLQYKFVCCMLKLRAMEVFLELAEELVVLNFHFQCCVYIPWFFMG
jgi:hypothetical protein